MLYDGIRGTMIYDDIRLRGTLCDVLPTVLQNVGIKRNKGGKFSLYLKYFKFLEV